MTGIEGIISSGQIEGTVGVAHSLPNAYTGDPEINIDAAKGPVKINNALSDSSACLELNQTAGTGPALQSNGEIVIPLPFGLVTGDISFLDKTCIHCKKPFQIEERLVFQIVKIEDSQHGLQHKTQPRHQRCKRWGFFGRPL